MVFILRKKTRALYKALVQKTILFC